MPKFVPQRRPLSVLPRSSSSERGINELHLFVYPLTRGAGPRLFTEDAAPGKLSLAKSESYDNGVVYLNYRPEQR